MVTHTSPLSQVSLKSSNENQNSYERGMSARRILPNLLITAGVLFYLVRSIMTQNDAQRLASFNADWSFPQVRSFYRVLSVVWGCVTISQVMLVALLAFTLPISLMWGSALS